MTIDENFIITICMTVLLQDIIILYFISIFEIVEKNTNGKYGHNFQVSTIFYLIMHII